MDIQQIRFGVFLGIFLLMLWLESVIQRHPTVDSKKNRLKINLVLTGIDILVVKLVFGAAAVGAAQFAEEKGWGLFNYLGWWNGLEVVLVIIILDLMIYTEITRVTQIFLKRQLVPRSLFWTF